MIDIGNELCLTMSMQIFAYQSGTSNLIMLNSVLPRLRDRGFRWDKAKENGEDVVRTKQLRQKDLNKIYTGPQI